MLITKRGLLPLLVVVLGLSACASKKQPQKPGVAENLPATLNVVGVRGIVGATLRNPASSMGRLLHQMSSTTVAFMHPGMETFAGGSRNQPPLSRHPGMNIAAFETALDRKVRPVKTRGTLRLLIDGPQFFPVLIDALRTTREPVDMQMYIFDSDDVAVQIADELKATSKRVPVRVLFDDLGSMAAARIPPDSKVPHGFKPPPDILAYLKQDSAIDARRLNNSFLTSTHTKIITFNNSRAFTGGMNIGREYRYDWHDMMVEMRGPIVGVMNAEFKRALSRTNFADDLNALQADKQRPDSMAVAEPRGAFEIRLLRTRPFNQQIERAIHLAIKHAQRRIWIEDPYLADDRLIGALIDARKRGVDVRVILPKKSDEKIMSGSNKVTAAVLLKHGVRVFSYPGVHHVKASLYDDWALLGSANMDHLSLRVNDELNIAYSHPAAVRDLEAKLFLKDFKVSQEEQVGTVKPTQGDKFSEILADRL